MWSAYIGISWRGGSTKNRKAVAISTPFYFHRMASRATGFPVEPELVVCCFREGSSCPCWCSYFSLCNHRVLNWDFRTNSSTQC